MIELKAVLAQMELTDRNGAAIPFKIDFSTGDEKNQTGGEIIVYESATLCFPNSTGTRKFNAARMIQKNHKLIKARKSPRHVKNGTINIQTAAGITTVCIWLIRYFNDEKVILHVHG